MPSPNAVRPPHLPGQSRPLPEALVGPLIPRINCCRPEESLRPPVFPFPRTSHCPRRKHLSEGKGVFHQSCDRSLLFFPWYFPNKQLQYSPPVPCPESKTTFLHSLNNHPGYQTLPKPLSHIFSLSFPFCP